MIKVLFFGRLREALHCAEMTLSDVGIDSVSTLKAVLYARQPDWQPLLDDGAIQVAVNQVITADQCVLASGDEVAFFPPVTGG